MAIGTTINTINNNLNHSTFKKNKIVTFASKKNEKRITTLSGFMAKLQQSIDNNEEQFVYYATKKLLPLLVLLREKGIIQNFHTLTSGLVRKECSLSLSPSFQARVLVVYLKTADKYAPALRNIKMLTVPSRTVSMSRTELLKKVLAAGPATWYVLNTSRGLLTHMEALHYQIGGEVICEIK